MILKFNEYIKLNEDISSFTYGEAKKLFPKIGLDIVKTDKGDSIKIFRKNYCVVKGNLKHDGSKDEMRTIDINTLKALKKFLANEFKESGDMDIFDMLKSIPWKKCGFNTSIFDKELDGYDPETGEKIEKSIPDQELNIGHKLQKARVEKEIKAANELYKDATIIKIDENDDDSAFILMSTNKYGNLIYNTCRSNDDRRPILKEWFPQSNVEKKGNNYFFGKDDARIWKVKYYRVQLDGTLEKKVNYIKENKSEKNLEML